MFERAVGAGAQIEFLHDGLVLLVSQKKIMHWEKYCL